MSTTWQVCQGDALEVLRTLPERSVQTCVTSPPYFGLRDYGTGAWEGGDSDCDHLRSNRYSESTTLKAKVTDGASEAKRTPYGSICGKCGATRTDSQVGLEATPDEYVARLVEVFREVRRVLRDDGTLWLNLGDSYASSWPCNRRNEIGAGSLENGKRENRPPRMGDGMKEKDLMGIPWMVAFALRADGWYLRSDIVWNKPNPMPESVTDRPTKAHEYVFLLSKGPRYFYDADAIREDHVTESNVRDPRQEDYGTNGRLTPLGAGEREFNHPAGRNKRSVWTVATQPFSFGAQQGGSAYRASPDCPEHGLRAAPERWRMAADGGPQDHYQFRIDSTDARRALGLPDESDASSFRSPDPALTDAQSTESERTSRSTSDHRTPDPSSREAAAESDAASDRTKSSRARSAPPADSSDSLDPTCAATATSRSSESRRTAPVPATNPSCTPSGETPSDTDGIPAPPSFDGHTPHTAASSISGDAGGGEKPPSPSARRSSRRSSRCTCEEILLDHFAVFPPKLIEPCVKAGSAEGTTVLDPFSGAGTTGLVATRLGRSYIGIELSESYAEMSRERIRDDAPLMNYILEQEEVVPTPN